MRSRWFGLVIAMLATAVSLWAYPRLSDMVVTHWNFRGEPDGYSPRLLAAGLMPLLIVLLWVLFQVLPRIDPRGVNYAKFAREYWLLLNGVLVFTGVLHIVVIGNGIGITINVGRVVPIAVGALFMLFGNYLGRVQSNWFLGIRTPWTLSSDTVWRRTHRTAGWLFMIGGVLMMAMAFLRHAAIVPVFIGTIVLVGLAPIVLSYVLWKREQSS